MRYATSQKAADSIPDEVIDFFFSIYLIFPVALGSGVYLASNRNECQQQKKMFLGSGERPAPEADNFSAICEPTVRAM
jgi:hypothetical protein